MRIKETKVYQFAELSDKAKERVIENMADINVSYEWWDCEYEDAAQIGLKLMEFDLDRNRHCKGHFSQSALETADKIIDQHGACCTSHETATQFLKDSAKLLETIPEDLDGDGFDNAGYRRETAQDELDNEFLKSALEDYSIILQKQYEYYVSEGAVIETIEINEYEFTEDGKLA